MSATQVFPGSVDESPLRANSSPSKADSFGKTLGANRRKQSSLDATVMIVDDEPVNIKVVQKYLRNEGYPRSVNTSDSRQAMELIRDECPDIILLDMRLGERDGITVLDQLNQAGNTVPVVILSTSRASRDLIACLQRGAKGYLLKDMEPNQLVEALHRVSQGETAIAPEMAGALAQHVQTGGSGPPAVPQRFSELTPRETEILSHLAEGQSNKVIARQLGISDGTVKLHVKAILRKLGVHSRVEAAVLAVEHGMNQATERAHPVPAP